MDILHALILSAVEGITEYLPVSSTGHMVLASDLLKIPQTEFVKSFEVIIQLGAILAVVILYFKRLTQSREIWYKILTAFLPTATIGFLLYKVIKHFLLGNVMVTITSLFVGGIILIIWEKLYKEKDHHLDKIEKLSYKNAFIIGLAQSISVIPGVSRSAATILGGLGVGLKRKTAVEFSFLLAVPTMVAATGLDLVKSNFNFTGNEWMVLAVGFIGAFVTAMFAVKYFVRYVQNHTFVAFGVYRIILAIVFWLLIIR